jgi:hypothetical protein
MDQLSTVNAKVVLPVGACFVHKDNISTEMFNLDESDSTKLYLFG